MKSSVVSDGLRGLRSWQNLKVVKRALGWLLALLGIASLTGPMFLVYSWFASVPVQIRGGLFTVVFGSLITGLLFWGSAKLSDRASEDRRGRTGREIVGAAQ